MVKIIELISTLCLKRKSKIKESHFMDRKKTWQEKLKGNAKLPKIITLTKKLQQRWGKGKMVVPSPKEVDAVMKRVPQGQVITINEIRQTLAKQHKVSLCCPVTVGIFAWLAAHAAQEAIDKAKSKSRLIGEL